MERARRGLIWRLDNADGDDLRQAVREAGEYLYKLPDDEQVTKALECAEKRLAGPAAD